MNTKQNNKIRVNISNDIPDWVVSYADLPKFSQGKWDYLKIILYQPIDLNLIDPILSLIEKSNLADEVLFFVNIESLDVDSNLIDTWTIGVENIDVDFGAYDINSSGIQLITITIKPHHCAYSYDK